MPTDLAADALGVVSGMLVGFSLGLVGGGGSILSVPLMIYLVGVPSVHVAIGTTAFAVAVNAAATLDFACPHGNGDLVLCGGVRRSPAWSAPMAARA